MLVTYFAGGSAVISWVTTTTTLPIKVPAFSFDKGIFDLTLLIDSFILMTRFEGSDLQLSAWPGITLLIIFLLGMSLGLTLVTYLKRFSYILGMVVILLITVNFKTELLRLWGMDYQIGLIVAMVLWLPVSYYFHAYRTHTGFLPRWGIFLLLFSLWIGILVFGAQVASPLLFISTYGIAGPVVIAILFIFMVAHELPILFINTATRLGPQAMTHYFVISGFYLVFLGLTYLHRINVIDWDLVYVDPYMLLVLSTALGIWGFRQREPVYENILPFRFIGAYGYLTLATITMTTISYFMVTGNDPWLLIFRDAIFYTHLGYGIIFLIYIVANFLPFLSEGRPVSKVLFKPRRMPYFTFRLAGLIAVIAFTVKSNWEVPLYHGISGYYNGLGDLYTINGNHKMAEGYYHEGSQYGYANHKSNYAVARIAEKEKNYSKAVKHYELAVIKRPTPQAYVNLSNLYLRSNKPYDALFKLQEADRLLKGQAPIQNNLGLIYSRINVNDSAAYYLERAMEDGYTQNVAGANLIGFSIKNDLNIDPDSLFVTYGSKDNMATKSNAALGFIRYNRLIPQEWWPEQEASSLDRNVLVFNMVLGNVFQEKPLISDEQFQNLPGGTGATIAQMAQALNSIGHHDFRAGYASFNRLAESNPSMAGYFNYLMGTLALFEGNSPEAVNYFKKSRAFRYPDADYYLAIALSEADQWEEALTIWEALKDHENSQIMAQAELMARFITSYPTAVISGADDQLKYLMARYALDPGDDDLVLGLLLDGASDDNTRAEIILEAAWKWYDLDEYERATEVIALMEGLTITRSRVYQRSKWFEMNLAAVTGNLLGMVELINEGWEFTWNQLPQKYWFTGLINQESRDYAGAEQAFAHLAYGNPFFPDGVIAAANFHNIYKEDGKTAYDIIVDNLQFNKNSVKLMKAYILLCGQLGYKSYGTSMLEELKGRIPENTYNEMEEHFETLLMAWEESLD